MTHEPKGTITLLTELRRAGANAAERLARLEELQSATEDLDGLWDEPEEQTRVTREDLVKTLRNAIRVIHGRELIQ